jgi:exodeoxyribonuclease VII large subunit
VDDVADLRCSTPTDAGKRVVPDAAAELRAVQMGRHRMRRALAGWVDTESARLARLTAAPALADPIRPLLLRADDVAGLTARALTALLRRLDTGAADLARRSAQLSALGPAATLARGYAVVQAVSPAGNRVLRHADDAPAGTALRIRVGDGALLATSNGTEEGR